MSANLNEQRLQVLEVLSEKIQRLDENVRELKSEKKADSDKIELIRITLSNMQGADLNKQVDESKRAIVDLEKRVRTLEDFKNNLIGRLLVIGVITTLITGILGALIVKLLTR